VTYAVLMEEQDDRESRVKLVENLLKIVNDEARNSLQGVLRDVPGVFNLFKDTYGFNTSYVDLSEGGLLILESVCPNRRAPVMRPLPH